jgi:hypothetical protein
MNFAAQNLALRQQLQVARLQPRCFGIAKNFMTNALKADPNAALPTYPWIFTKPLTSLVNCRF